MPALHARRTGSPSLRASRARFASRELREGSPLAGTTSVDLHFACHARPPESIVTERLARPGTRRRGTGENVPTSAGPIAAPRASAVAARSRISAGRSTTREKPGGHVAHHGDRGRDEPPLCDASCGPRARVRASDAGRPMALRDAHLASGPRLLAAVDSARSALASRWRSKHSHDRALARAACSAHEDVHRAGVAQEVGKAREVAHPQAEHVAPVRPAREAVAQAIAAVRLVAAVASVT